MCTAAAITIGSKRPLENRSQGTISQSTTAATMPGCTHHTAGRLALLPLLLLAAAVAVGAVRETKYYDALGVSPDADERTIQKAYRRQAL